MLVLGSIASTPYLGSRVPSLPGAQGAMIATLICFSAMTSYLLFTQFYANRQRPLVILGSAYLFSTLMGIPYLFEFAGSVTPGSTQLGNPIATTWLTIFESAGFALLTLAYAIVQASDDEQVGERDAWSLIGNSLLGVSGIVLLIVAPLMLSRYLPLPPLHFIGPLLISLTAASLITTAIATRGRTVLHLWLLVALVALLLDVTMTTNFQQYGTLGWYVAMFYRVLTAILLLIPLLSELTAVSARMSTLAGLDGLTGLPNRRALDDRIDAFLSDGRRRNDVLSVLMIDIDHFKKFNDDYGHAAGDEALRAVSKVVNRSLARAGDFVGRYGGEEFVVLLPETEREGALTVAERIRSGVARLPVKFAPNLQRITVSVGVASLPRSDIPSAGVILGMADKALYNAKGAGRNIVMEAPRELEPVRSPYDGDVAVN